MHHHLIEERPTFKAVIYNWDDQVTVRKLLMECVPEDAQAKIVARFNQHVRERNRIARELNEEEEAATRCSRALGDDFGQDEGDLSDAGGDQR
jgi:hypothetical protein